MSGSLLDLKVVKKNVVMENKLLTKSKSYSRRTGRKDKDGHPIEEWAGQSSMYSYKSFTKSDVEFFDESASECYQLTVIEDDFLPLLGRSINVYVGHDKEVLAYQPYRNAKPVMVDDNFPNFSPVLIIKRFLTNLVFAVPILPVLAVFGLHKECKEYKAGVIKNRLFLNILVMLILLSFQVYFTYFLYDKGRHHFWEAMAGFLAGGVIVAVIYAYSDIQNMLNTVSYKRQIKRNFKSE